MILEEITQDLIIENRMVWRKVGNKVVRAVRCTTVDKVERTASFPFSDTLI